MCQEYKAREQRRMYDLDQEDGNEDRNCAPMKQQLVGKKKQPRNRDAVFIMLRKKLND